MYRTATPYCDDIKQNELVVQRGIKLPRLKRAFADVSPLADCLCDSGKTCEGLSVSLLVITKMAEVCSKMVDGWWVNFPVPVLDHSLLSEPDSRPAEARALCSLPEQFNPLINCSPQRKKKKKAEKPVRGLQGKKNHQTTLTSNSTDRHV